MDYCPQCGSEMPSTAVRCRVCRWVDASTMKAYEKAEKELKMELEQLKKDREREELLKTNPEPAQQSGGFWDNLGCLFHLLRVLFRYLVVPVLVFIVLAAPFIMMTRGDEQTNVIAAGIAGLLRCAMYLGTFVLLWILSVAEFPEFLRADPGCPHANREIG